MQSCAQPGGPELPPGHELVCSTATLKAGVITMIFGGAIWFVHPEIQVLGFEGSSGLKFMFQGDSGLY